MDSCDHQWLARRQTEREKQISITRKSANLRLNDVRRSRGTRSVKQDEKKTTDTSPECSSLFSVTVVDHIRHKHEQRETLRIAQATDKTERWIEVQRSQLDVSRQIFYLSHAEPRSTCSWWERWSWFLQLKQTWYLLDRLNSFVSGCLRRAMFSFGHTYFEFSSSCFNGQQ